MHASRGYSLIEFMVALVVAVLLGIVMTILLTNTTHQASTLKESADISNESRTLMFLMTRDIANAGYMLSCVNQGCGKMLQVPLTQAINNTGCDRSKYSFACIPDNPAVSPSPPACSSSSIVGCPAVIPLDDPTAKTKTLTLNYAALSTTDVIQVAYRLNTDYKILQRKQVNAKDDKAVSFVDLTLLKPGEMPSDALAANVVDMAFEFLPGGASPPKEISQLRSIKVALLTRSEQPDKKYTSPVTITWLGGIYTVPTNESHYRFRVIQQDVFLLNPGIIDP